MVINNLNMPEKNTPFYQLYILLNTVRGTVPLFRDLGLDGRMTDRPVTTISAGIQSELQTQIKKYISKLRLVQVNCFMEEGKFKIECEVELNG